jgi:hypothetical protein
MDSEALVQTFVIGVSSVVLVGLVYLGARGAHRLFRDARRTALQAGHRPRSAAARAALRTVLWVLYFAAFYAAVYLLGRRMGWWVILPASAALALLVAGLLRADDLLTVRPGDRRRQIRIGATLAVLGTLFGSAIWFGAQYS